jgi:VanZ family protein
MARSHVVWNNSYRNIIFVVLIALFFVPVPTYNLWWREAGNSCHTLLFFLVSIPLYHLVTQRVQVSNKVYIYIIVLVGGVLLGSLIEVLQSFTQRDSSISDVYRDSYGIIASLCLIQVAHLKDSYQQKLKAVIYMIACVAFLLAGFMPLVILSWHYIERQNAFPVIVDLNANWSSSFIEFNSAEIVAAQGEHNKFYGMSLVQFNQGQYPGISVIEPEPDWSNYHTLHLKMSSNYDHDIDLVLRVHDREHNQDITDRFNKRLVVKPGLNDFEIDLKQIENGPINRQLDLKSIDGLILFSVEQKNALQIGLGNIYLE